MTSSHPVRRGAVVAVKAFDQAKTRLATLPGPLRHRLAQTMALDTLSVLSSVIDEVLVVSGQSALEQDLAVAGLEIDVLPEPGPLGLNGALGYGAEVLRARGADLVLACVADLPALRAASVRRVLAAADERPRSLVADAAGTGTTMLVARGGALDPHFQGSSAAAHVRSGAVPLTDELLGAAVPDARTDVDTEADLRATQRLGLGPATTALLGRVRAGAA